LIFLFVAAFTALAATQEAGMVKRLGFRTDKLASSFFASIGFFMPTKLHDR